MNSTMQAHSDAVWLSIAEAGGLLRERKLSPVELTRAYLDRIARLNPRLNAFITVTDELAMQQARAAEQEIAAGKWRGPLHGIPIALKDLVETAGVRTTAASGVLKNNVPTRDAAIVERLRQAGAVLLGKTNLHEFAYGGSGVISYFGPARNPWNPGHITGGSSSGSASAVGAAMCCAAIGTDTAGSIRLPASCCGIVGHKPSYGLVSALGVIPLSWSFDHVGPMTRTVRDAALMLDSIAGFARQDFTSREYEKRNYAPALDAASFQGLRIGVGRNLFADCDSGVVKHCEEALAVMKRDGAQLREIDVPDDPDRTASTSESYAYHARTFLGDHEADYSPVTVQRIRAGEKYSATDYIMKKRDLDAIRNRGLSVFDEVDVVVSPTTPQLPPSFAELEEHPDRLRPAELKMLRNTRPFNVLGWPCVSVPCGFSSTGLPIGLQIAAAPGRDDVALRVADAFERKTEWHKKRAPVE